MMMDNGPSKGLFKPLSREIKPSAQKIEVTFVECARNFSPRRHKDAKVARRNALLKGHLLEAFEPQGFSAFAD